MRRFTCAAIAALILAMTLALPVSADMRRPMHGTFDGSAVAVEQSCGPAALTLGFEIGGVATHLGRFSGTGSNCTEFTLATDAVAIWDGIIDLEASDGSTLRLHYTGAQGAPGAGIATFSHSDTVVSGTGRFEGAAGTLIVRGHVDLVTLTVSGTVSGWLSY